MKKLILLLMVGSLFANNVNSIGIGYFYKGFNIINSNACHDMCVDKVMTQIIFERNKFKTPKIEKIVINMGLGIDGNDQKILKTISNDLSLISGQKPIVTKFKKSISNFKTRKGTIAGVKVTIRGNRMYEFIDRLVNIALPRIKDFEGLSIKGFDNFGNYSFGIKEHIVFPEINFDKVDRIRGMDITLVTNNRNKKATFALLEALNFPFIKKDNKKEMN